jgi:DNA-binding NtrC family response regulator
MSKTVLLMDSQLTSRRMLRFAMTLQELQVVEILNTADLLTEQAAGYPVLLVIGINANDADDQLALIGEIRRRPAFADLPLLLVGESQLRSQWDLRSIGNCAWLTKPFRVNELHGLLENLLDSTSSLSTLRRKIPDGK